MGVIEPITETLHQRMIGTSWHAHPECPQPAELAKLRMSHWGMDGRVHRGELIIAAPLAAQVLDAFRSIFAARFPIARMVPIYVYGGDDEASMAANNTSAFNFRVVAGTSTLSQHSFGTAIDINPVQNPWIRDGQVSPAQGAEYLDRKLVRPGMIVRPGPVTGAFDAIGWHWGGDWDQVKDYHHFSKQSR